MSSHCNPLQTKEVRGAELCYHSPPAPFQNTCVWERGHMGIQLTKRLLCFPCSTFAEAKHDAAHVVCLKIGEQLHNPPTIQYNTIQYNTIQYNCTSPLGNYRNSCSPLTIQPHIVNDAHTVFGRGSHAALYYKYKLWVPHMTTKSRRKDINNHKIRLSTQQTSTIDFNIYTQTKMHCEINIIVERQVRLISINTHKQKCTVW